MSNFFLCLGRWCAGQALQYWAAPSASIVFILLFGVSQIILQNKATAQTGRARWFWWGGAAWGNRWSVLMRVMLLEISPTASAAAVAAAFHSRCLDVGLLWSQRSRSPHSGASGEKAWTDWGWVPGRSGCDFVFKATKQVYKLEEIPAINPVLNRKTQGHSDVTGIPDFSEYSADSSHFTCDALSDL